MFWTVLLCLGFWHLVGVFGEPVSVKEGDSVTLNSSLTEVKGNDVIQWMFGYKSIAKMCVTHSTVNYVLDGRFRDRLKLDNQTGSLTITNTRPEHEGRYELQINSLRKSFNLTVQHCSSCMFEDPDEISVMVGYQFNLYTGLTEMKDGGVIQWRFLPENTLIAEINKRANSFTVYDDVLDGRFRDRLKLDNQTGSLTITNMRTDHTGVYERQTNSLRKSYIFTVNSRVPVPVISRDCPSSSDYLPNQQHTCADSVRGCDSVEAVIRLVVTALVGVAAAAAVVVLVYDIRSRRAELDLARIPT
ncbi:uncharacterized protein [Pseudorasbora parva]|uniref:uncharacterized protein n=1 Tax=Pseudorasbora parva TaxID=51549 RepID=UPI00351E7ED9